MAGNSNYLQDDLNDLLKILNDIKMDIDNEHIDRVNTLMSRYEQKLQLFYQKKSESNLGNTWWETTTRHLINAEKNLFEQVTQNRQTVMRHINDINTGRQATIAYETIEEL